ncbi:MAG: methionine--tRNA ligase [Planctomycetota bacterium]
MPGPSFYISTPIYYVNDKPHIGHAYTTILADVITRYQRLLGRPSFFLTGTDEHGQKVDEAATKLGRTPIEHCNETVKRFQELWVKLGITNDAFIRTTDANHVAVVQEVLQDLFDRGEIYRGSYTGWYCVPCERFFTAKDVKEGNCPDCARPLRRIEEPNYFFRMGKYQAWLIEHIETHPEFIQPDFRANEVLGFLKKEPLADLCVSRPKERLSWGIELPFDRAFVCYVWFDALLNYVTGVGFRRDERQFNAWWPATCHLLGKDILTTHAVYWTTMLKAMGLPQPQTIFAHGWWLTRDAKMSKTAGNVVNPMDMVDKYGVDAFRYFLIAEMKMGKDCNFSEEIFVERFNADLANDLGNLLSRCTAMIGKHCDGRLPAGGPAGPAEAQVAADALATVVFAEAAIMSMGLDRMTGRIIEFVRSMNRYFDENAPWKLIKSGDRAGFERVMYTTAEALRVVAGLLHPVMPGKMTELRCALGMGDAAPAVADLRRWGVLKPGTALGTTGHLFPRIEPAKLAADLPTVAIHAAAAAPVRITFDEFKKVQLRTARVLACEAVPKSAKLLKLRVDLGGEERTIVAGVAQHYQAADMVGRTIVVVANLEKAKIFGIESEGMLLAVHTPEGLALLTGDKDVPPGCPIS